MGLLDAIQDPRFRSDVGRGLLDSVNRGAVGGLLGGPVDLAALALRPFGYSNHAPVGGSEWFGQRMEDAGMVSPNRNPLAEALAGVASPLAASKLNKLGELAFSAEQAIAKNATLGPSAGSREAQRGALGFGPKEQVAEVMEQLQNIPKGQRVGIRVLPDDWPTPNIGDSLPVSTRWIDGLKTDKPLYGTSAMDISSRKEQEIERAMHLLGFWSNSGHYPGNKLSIISGPSKRRGEDKGEAMIKDAIVRYVTDLPKGPR